MVFLDYITDKLIYWCFLKVLQELLLKQEIGYFRATFRYFV